MIKLKTILLEDTSSDILQFEKGLAMKYNEYLEQLHFYYDAPSNSIFLTDIYIKPQYKGKGMGTKIMKELIQFSNSLKLPIQLIPATDSLHTKSLRRLINFYRRFGFIENKGNPQFDADGMYRLPK